LIFLKKMGLKVFSDPEKILNCYDRMSGTLTLRAGNIPMPETVITENLESAVEALEKFEIAVFKPLYSTKARGMKMISVKDEHYKSAIRRFSEENPTMYIQKKIEIPGHDLGVAFIGGQYLATYARVSSGKSWNTTIYSGGKYSAYQPSQEIIDLAHKAQALFGLDFTSVDVVETTEGPMVFEVSAFGGFRGLYEANGIDAARLYVDYVLKNL